MFGNMLEVKFDSDLDKYVVAPLANNGQEDFMVVCDSEYIAKSLCAQLSMQMIPRK